ncbi:hypothetical protein HZA56_01560 [Candidatus Poribacteria bacterium]|nr:hypothetical protein [Candidatus Poribacteria bacterium]
MHRLEFIRTVYREPGLNVTLSPSPSFFARPGMTIIVGMPTDVYAVEFEKRSM